MYLATTLVVMLAIRSSGPDLAGEARKREAEKDWVGAAQIWDQMAASNPTMPFYPLNAANDYYNAKQFEQAISKYQKADSLGVSYPWDMPYSIACCDALLGRKREALDWLEKALSLGYRDLDQVRTDKDLESLHGDARFTKLAAAKDASKMSRTEGYRYDLWLLDRELRRLHYSPYLRNPKKSFDDFVTRLNREIPTLSDAQIAVRLKTLMAMAGDGHTHLTTSYELAGAKKGMPVFFSEFAEGAFVIGADKDHEDLLGCRVVKVGGVLIADALQKIRSICSYDNEQWVLARRTTFLRYPGLLNGLGLSASPDKTVLTLQDAAGATRDVELSGTSDANGEGIVFVRQKSANPTPLTFLHRDKNYWFEQLPGTKTVFFQYNAVQDMKGESIKTFADRLFGFIASQDVDRLIIDMRWNGGGNNFLNKPLLEGLIKCKLNVKGKLFVIVGRNTFSAAMCGATQIERYTEAIFAGEPTGSSPNFIGESIPVQLPYSHMRGTVSDLYWQNSVAMDHRVWISPEIYVPPTFADYAANRDPVMDAIEAYRGS